METSVLKALAQERGLSAIRKKALGTVTILESKTGKLVGVYGNTEEALSVIYEFPIIPPLVVEPSTWTYISQATDAPKRCANGYGPGCLCLDETFLYLCAVNICPNKAECNGTCRGHFSQLRIFGDLTKAAISKTDQFHKEGQPLKVFPATLPLKFYRGTAKDWSTLTPGELNLASDGIIGMTVKFTGTHYVLLDKDGHVVSKVESKNDLLVEEDEED